MTSAGAVSAKRSRARRLPTRRAPQSGRRGGGCEVVVADAEPLALVCRQVDPVELVVLAHVTEEVRQLEGDAEPREALGSPRHAEDRRP